MTGLYYEEFEVGETIEHDRRRTISEADNQKFLRHDDEPAAASSGCRLRYPHFRRVAYFLSYCVETVCTLVAKSSYFL